MMKNISIALLVLAIAAGAYWGYTLYERHSARLQATALVKDSSTRLRVSLEKQAVQSDANAGNPEASLKASEAAVTTLRGLDTSSFTPFADAADGYLVTAREILRRHSEIEVAETRFAASLPKLSLHIQSDRGRSGWPQEAVRLKEIVDQDYRDYRIATESYASLLESLPAAQKKIAPYVDSTLLIDDKSIGDAQRRAVDALALKTVNVKQVTTLDTYRGRRR